MKRIIKLIILVLCCVVLISMNATAAEGEYVSQIVKENCFLCGSIENKNLSRHWGEDNVGVVHLNTFDVLPLRINRYNDSGDIISDKFGILETAGLYRDDTYVNSITDPDRGYTSIQITKVKYMVDRKAVQTNLCEECIESMNGVYWCSENPPEYAIINFKERTIRPLEKSLTWFFSGNYGINCEYKENGNIDLLIVYLPLRWDHGE